MKSPRKTILAVCCALAALPARVRAEDDRPGERERVSPADRAAGSSESKDREAGRAPSPEAPARPAPRKAATRPETSVLMPRAGVYRAPAVLRLAGRLYGFPVRVESRNINEIPVTISPALAHRRVGLEAVRIVLLAHSLHLHVWDHPARGPILVASLDPNWTPPVARLTRVLHVDGADFWRVVRELRDRAAELNEKLPPNLEPVLILPFHRSGKIVVRAPSSALAEELTGTFRKSRERRRDVLPLREYVAKHRSAEDLLPALEGELGIGTWRRLRIAPGPTGNSLLYRADDELAETVRDALERVDKPEGRLGSALPPRGPTGR